MSIIFIEVIFHQLLNFDPSQLKNGIATIHPIIKQHINFETLVSFLNHFKIFTDDEIEYFNSTYDSKVSKVNNLIEWLKQKDDDGIINFVKALNEANKHNGHNTILKKLHETMLSFYGAVTTF